LRLQRTQRTRFFNSGFVLFTGDNVYYVNSCRRSSVNLPGQSQWLALRSGLHPAEPECHEDDRRARQHSPKKSAIKSEEDASATTIETRLKKYRNHFKSAVTGQFRVGVCQQTWFCAAMLTRQRPCRGRSGQRSRNRNCGPSRSGVAVRSALVTCRPWRCNRFPT
jgi:hypothetical protein